MAAAKGGVVQSVGIINFWAFVLGTVFIILLPGPNSLFVLSSSAAYGVREGYKAACGVLVGDFILMTLAALGAASLLNTMPLLFMGIKYCGAAYLFYLGMRLLMSAFRRPAPVQTVDLRPSEHGRFHKALLLSLLNPKAILFFISFFVQFVDPLANHPAWAFLILGVVVEVISFTYLSLLIFGGDRLAGLFRRHQHLARMGNGSVGTLFMGFAARMVAD